MNKLILVLFLFLSTGRTFAYKEIFERYFQDTYQGIEAMRNKATGLVVDSTLSSLLVLNDNTSPSNIGLDLLVQMEALQFPAFQKLAHQNIRSILLTLDTLNYHQLSGLFFNRYSSDGKNVADYYISSVDNLHLAFALWVISKSHPDTEERYVARHLFKRLNFSPLFNKDRNLFAGGLYYQNGSWVREAWHYDYFGSEGRSLYSIGSALDLKDDTIPKLTFEMNGNLLRLWDGGAFQLLLPRLLVREDLYSEKMKHIFSSYAHFILEKSIQNNWPVPAAHSAGQISLTDYTGKAGSPEMVATSNTDQISDDVFTPHAALIAAPISPDAIATAMYKAEDLGIYMSGLGWLDGYHVKGKNKGTVVQVFLSLDQTMIALAMAQALSKDGMTVGNRALQANPEVRKKLSEFYLRIPE